MSDYQTCRVEKDCAAAAVRLILSGQLTRKTSDLHRAFGEVFGELHGDTVVRVAGLTAMGGEFCAARTSGFLTSEAARRSLCELAGSFKTFTSVLCAHQTMARLKSIGDGASPPRRHTTGLRLPRATS